MKYHISYKNGDGVGCYQAVLVEATSERIAKGYFEEKKPESKILGIHEATRDDMKPGKPVLVVPNEFRLEFIKEHQRDFLKKMEELEKQGFRSGGWDEKSDKTAIVRPGEREIDNAIVGYMDRDLNIEWETGEAVLGLEEDNKSSLDELMRDAHKKRDAIGLTGVRDPGLGARDCMSK